MARVTPTLVPMGLSPLSIRRVPRMAGFSPLHIAALYNQVALARHLLSMGADATSANNWNDTPLHRAATQGYSEMCQLLLHAGADPYFEDWRNKTPADYAKEELKRPAMRVFREWRKKHPPHMPWED